MPLPIITSARTPAYDLPYLFPGQAQKEAFVNEAMARLDALIHPVVRDEVAAPPADPEPGDCYLVADPAGGAWSGREGSLAVWAENQWLHLAPRQGMRVHDLAAGSVAVFTTLDGWTRAAAPLPPLGGSTQDSEARAAIGQVVAKLHSLGIFSA